MIVLPRQARDKHSLGKALKRKGRFLADPAILCNQGAAAWYGNCLFRHCIDYSNLEHLPRQARDKHEGNALKQKDVSSAGIAGLLVAAVLGQDDDGLVPRTLTGFFIHEESAKGALSLTRAGVADEDQVLHRGPV